MKRNDITEHGKASASDIKPYGSSQGKRFWVQHPNGFSVGYEQQAYINEKGHTVFVPDTLRRIEGYFENGVDRATERFLEDD